MACTPLISQDSEHISLLQRNLKDETSKSVVILPFDNETPEPGIEILARKSFSNHFSSKSYRDSELNDTDLILEIHDRGSKESWKDLSPQYMAKLFHADYLIFGSVKEFKKIFLGIYSQIALEIGVKIVDGKSGDTVWLKSILKRSHDGGLPFDLLSIIPAAFRSGAHMRKDKTLELIDRVNRELINEIPDIPDPPRTPYFVEIQVASFQDSTRAHETLRVFEGKGFKPRVVTVMLDDSQWHRVILGPYVTLSEAEKIKDRIIEDSEFQPFFIHHYPEKEDTGPQID